MWLSLWRCCLGDDVFVVEMFEEMLLVVAEVFEEMLLVVAEVVGRCCLFAKIKIAIE